MVFAAIEPARLTELVGKISSLQSRYSFGTHSEASVSAQMVRHSAHGHARTLSRKQPLEHTDWIGTTTVLLRC